MCLYYGWRLWVDSACGCLRWGVLGFLLLTDLLKSLDYFKSAGSGRLWR